MNRLMKMALEKELNELKISCNSQEEKDRERKWKELTKQVLDENRGAWEKLGTEEKK